jgi:PhnB protein
MIFIKKETYMALKKINTPPGASTLAPYMIVKSIEDQIDFFKKVFDSEVADTVKQPDGAIMHAEVRIGDSTIMLGKANEKYPSNQSMVYIFVNDADAAYRKALESGAKSLMVPEDRFYGNREGGVIDPQGNTWWIAQYQRQVPKEEIDKYIAEMPPQK